MPLLEGDPGREPLVIVEIDQDLCEEVYSVAPCVAAIGVTGAFKCYNSRKTCQDPANYNITTPTPLTLRFIKPSSSIPVGENLLPFLVSVSSTPTRVNIGGRPVRDGSFGKRSSVTITMKDHPHSDNLVDPYLADRSFTDPLNRSTFWAKWLARNPFYNGRAIRIREGYVGQAIANMQVRHYIIDKVEEPDAQNNVVIRASDILRLADDKKSVAPELSTGELDQDYPSTGTIAAVADPGDYPSAGVIRVDNEVMRYTFLVEGGGISSFTGITRGAEGTTAAAHTEGSTVQLCLEVNLPAWEAAYTILRDFGNVLDAFIDEAAWELEAEKWVAGFNVSRIITEPIGVTQLVGELCQQSLFYIWWDERAQEVRLRAVRPPLPSEVILITEDTDIIQGSVKTKVRPEERITEVWVSHTLRTPVDNVNDRDSYLNTRLRVDADASGADEYGDRVKYEILGAWLTGDAQVSPLSFRVLARYVDNPRYPTMELDAKDRTLIPGDVLDVDYRGFVDSQGDKVLSRFEVISVQEVQSGERIRIELQDSQFTNRYAFITQNGVADYPLATAAEIALGCYLSFPAGAGPAENFPSDDTPPYVFV